MMLANSAGLRLEKKLLWLLLVGLQKATIKISSPVSRLTSHVARLTITAQQLYGWQFFPPRQTSPRAAAVPQSQLLRIEKKGICSGDILLIAKPQKIKRKKISQVLLSI